MYEEEQKVDINETNVIYLDRVNSKTQTDASVIITFNVEKSSKITKRKIIFNLKEYEIMGKENSLSNEVRNYFRRRGIRFRPIHWRYVGDEGLFND